jgi:hypothetical protein
VWRLQGILARRRGDRPEARRLLQAAAELAEWQGSAESLASVVRDLADLLDATGESDAAQAARKRAVELYRRLGADKAARDLAALLR